MVADFKTLADVLIQVGFKYTLHAGNNNKKEILPIFLLPFELILPLPFLLTYLASLLIFLLSLWQV
jgi:hypothetical protein